MCHLLFVMKCKTHSKQGMTLCFFINHKDQEIEVSVCVQCAFRTSCVAVSLGIQDKHRQAAKRRLGWEPTGWIRAL